MRRLVLFGRVFAAPIVFFYSWPNSHGLIWGWWNCWRREPAYSVFFVVHLAWKVVTTIFACFIHWMISLKVSLSVKLCAFYDSLFNLMASEILGQPACKKRCLVLTDFSVLFCWSLRIFLVGMFMGIRWSIPSLGSRLKIKPHSKSISCHCSLYISSLRIPV